MAAAARAMVFGARYYHLPIAFGSDIRLDRVEKTGPAGAAVELGYRRKHREKTGGTYIGAIALFIIQCARPGTFRTFLEQYLVLLRVEQFTPLILSLTDDWEITA